MSDAMNRLATMHALAPGRLHALPPRRGRRRAAMVAALLCVSLAPVAQQSPAPDGAPPVVDAEQLVDLALDRPELVIVDSRMASDRKHGFIEGSISLPDVDTNCASLAELLPSPTTPVAFYCNGPKCDRSAAAGTIAMGCGYGETYWFHGGLEEWVRKGFPTLLD